MSQEVEDALIRERLAAEALRNKLKTEIHNLKDDIKGYEVTLAMWKNQVDVLEAHAQTTNTYIGRLLHEESKLGMGDY
jgi:hypothetical protein